MTKLQKGKHKEQITTMDVLWLGTKCEKHKDYYLPLMIKNDSVVFHLMKSIAKGFIPN